MTQNKKSLIDLEDWVLKILADPITKKPTLLDNFKHINGIIDARVFLKNTYGYSDWEVGQEVYERWEASGEGYNNQVNAYKKEIEYDRPIYEHYKMDGDILDVGGLTGMVREFLSEDCRFVSVDPYLEAVFKIPHARKEAYKCLSKRLNFIGALAEFLPFQSDSFDYVHMRSMLDHVQVPDLALKEANRVLKLNGGLIVGLYVEGGKSGRKPFIRWAKDMIKEVLYLIGIEKYKDFHTWHPTYINLLKLITDNGFEVKESYWQPFWKDQVVYVFATKQVPEQT
ncbi:MAG: class I SAM-dependent methyltransferase [Proteobacteria bacterium]|nr:class I SAM-dependent methyltransferase [Pseudomonadota bacterium]